MHEEEAGNEESEFQRRTEMLEEMLKDAALEWKPIEYLLIFDELGRRVEQEPEYQDIYHEGIRMKADLSETQIEEIRIKLGLIKAKPKKDLRTIAESYKKENEKQSENSIRNRRRSTVYSIAQYERDRAILQYAKIKRLDFKKSEYQTSEEIGLITEILGHDSLTVGPGNASAPIKECKPKRIHEVARDAYETAVKRMQEYERGEREIINGTP
jgi:hypothetical protein